MWALGCIAWRVNRMKLGTDRGTTWQEEKRVEVRAKCNPSRKCIQTDDFGARTEKRHLRMRHAQPELKAVRIDQTTFSFTMPPMNAPRSQILFAIYMFRTGTGAA